MQRRRWLTAIFLPLGVVVAVLAAILVVHSHGTRAHDPLTLNARARDAVVALAQPAGWSRTAVRTSCAGGEKQCAGGAFLALGTAETTWSTPPSNRKPAVAADLVCTELGQSLAVTASAARLDGPACVRASLAAQRTGRAGGTPFVAWTDSSGAWTMTAVPVLGATASAPRFAYDVQLAAR